jgi:hypothetical protein
MDENRDFNETVFALITALNAFMNLDEVSKSDKLVVRVNRFKVLVKNFADGVEQAQQANR